MTNTLYIENYGIGKAFLQLNNSDCMEEIPRHQATTIIRSEDSVQLPTPLNTSYVKYKF